MYFDNGGDGSMLFAGGGFMPTQSATILSSDVNSAGGTRVIVKFFLLLMLKCEFKACLWFFKCGD